MPQLNFLLKIFLWFSVRHLRRHLGRALVVLFGIALGAAVFTSVRLSVHASLQSFTRSMDFFAGTADKVLVRPGGHVPEGVLPVLLAHPAVKEFSPLLTTYVRVHPAKGGAFLLVGIDPLLDQPFRSWRLRGGRTEIAERWLDLIREPKTVILTEPLSREIDTVAGARITLDHSRNRAEFRVAGVLVPEGLALVEGGRVALTDIATFQEFTGLFGLVDRIDLRLRPKTSPAQLEDLARKLPEEIEIRSPSAARDSGSAMIRAYQLNLSVLSFASLFVGMFLVYSLVALNAASRRRELAILRALGASPRLLFNLFLAEGALFGVCGWLLAIPLGSVLVKYLLHTVSQTISTLFVRVHVEGLLLSPAEVAVSFGVTLCVAVAAAFQPARDAMRVPPKEAMEIAHTGRLRRRMAGRLAAWAAGCLLACVPLALLPGVAGVPLPGYLAILLLFVGSALMAPWLLEHLGRAVSPGLRRLAGTPAYLAGRYLRDSGARTSISVGALITAVALFTALVVMIHSFRQTVELWVRQTVSGDLFVTTKMGQVNRFQFPIPAEIVDNLREAGSYADLVPSRRYPLAYGDFPYEFEAMGMEPFLKHGGFVWLQGEAAEVQPRLVAGEGLLISEVFANRTGLEPGDTFRAWIEGSRVELPVAGVIRDYRTDGGVVFYSWDHFKERFHDPQWSGVRFYFRDRSGDIDVQTAALRELLIGRWGDRLDMISGKDLREAVLRIFDETFAITSVLLLIALSVAALGITTTMTVLVLERTRQLNTLLAVGASSRQVRAMICWEAGFLVTAGELAGLLCGFVLSYLLVYVINRQSFGWTFLYTVDWGVLALSAPLIVLTALAAALPAVRTALREPPAMLLRER
ncbi:MAG: FtsX-like permease family protein [Desulfobacterales bacterium]|nr:FtsX-like permease family protein [Desulfobacterales bacterium]